jgi:hypothetical protein
LLRGTGSPVSLCENLCEGEEIRGEAHHWAQRLGTRRRASDWPDEFCVNITCDHTDLPRTRKQVLYQTSHARISLAPTALARLAARTHPISCAVFNSDMSCHHQPHTSPTRIQTQGHLWVAQSMTALWRELLSRQALHKAFDLVPVAFLPLPYPGLLVKADWHAHPKLERRRLVLACQPCRRPR